MASPGPVAYRDASRGRNDPRRISDRPRGSRARPSAEVRGTVLPDLGLRTRHAYMRVAATAPATAQPPRYATPPLARPPPPPHHPPDPAAPRQRDRRSTPPPTTTPHTLTSTDTQTPENPGLRRCKILTGHFI